MKEKLSIKNILIAVGSAIVVLAVIWGLIFLSRSYSDKQIQTPYIYYTDWNHTLSKEKGFEEAKYWQSQAILNNVHKKNAIDSFYVHTIGGTLRLDGFCFLANSYFLENKNDSLYLKQKEFPLYVGIPWLKLKNEDDYYYFEDGKYFLVPSIKDRDKSGFLTNTHPAKVNVNFAVKKDPINQLSKNIAEKDQILVRMNMKYNTYSRCIVLSKILIIICALSYIILILYSVLIVWNISKGKPFAASNIRRLKICFIFSLIPLVIVYLSISIIYFFVYKYVNHYVSFDSSEIYIATFNYYLPGIYGFLLIAFARGHKLQQEQEYTI